MHERIERYYDGRSCGGDLGRGRARCAFEALLEGRTHGGDLFLMYPDKLMEEYLFPEDFGYWMECKRRSMDGRKSQDERG